MFSNDYEGEVTCPLICEEPGICQGILIHNAAATSTAECQEKCTNYSGCNYYTYDPLIEGCLMFDTCSEVDVTSCPTCLSGSPGCDIDEEKGNLDNNV